MKNQEKVIFIRNEGNKGSGHLAFNVGKMQEYSTSIS